MHRAFGHLRPLRWLALLLAIAFGLSGGLPPSGMATAGTHHAAAQPMPADCPHAVPADDGEQAPAGHVLPCACPFMTCTAIPALAAPGVAIISLPRAVPAADYRPAAVITASLPALFEPPRA